MDCPSVENLGLFSAGELDASERASFEAHLAECASCAGAVETLRAAQNAARADQPEISSQRWDTFEKDLMTRVRSAAVSPRRSSSTRRNRAVARRARHGSRTVLLRFALPLAAAAAILFALMLSRSGGEGGHPRVADHRRDKTTVQRPSGVATRHDSDDGRAPRSVEPDRSGSYESDVAKSDVLPTDDPDATTEVAERDDAGSVTEEQDLVDRPEAVVAQQDASASQSGVSIAFFSAVDAKVEYDRGGHWLSATEGTPLVTGDRVRTKFSRALVEFESGTKLHINRYTTLTITEKLKPIALSMVGGEIYVETVTGDKGFSVETPHGRAVDLGTRFGVDVSGNGTTVFVAEGTVEGSTDEGGVTLRVDQQVLLARPNAPPGKPRPVRNMAKRLAWTFGASRTPAVASRAARKVGDWASDWTHNGAQGFPKQHDEYRGRKGVWSAHPVDRGTPFVWKRTMRLSEGRHVLVMDVSTHTYDGEVVSDWELVVTANGRQVLSKLINKPVWQTETVDLSAFAGKTVELEISNGPGGGDPWRNEHGYFDAVRILSRGSTGGVIEQ